MATAWSKSADSTIDYRGLADDIADSDPDGVSGLSSDLFPDGLAFAVER